jgi:hypothetical protein
MGQGRHAYRCRGPTDQFDEKILDPRSQIEWNGKLYSIFGDAMINSASRRTAHVDYVTVRK